MRRLGDSDELLQCNKVHNLKLAILRLDTILIKPGELFSIWSVIGKTGYAQGYKDGMFLMAGKVSQGPGGGLCQLANLLFWMFIHSDLDIRERYHHGLDVFPDSHRVLPFGSGATLVYNYRDLIIKNNTQNTYQICLTADDQYLKGQLRSDNVINYKYHIIEKDHCFLDIGDERCRYNQIWREKYKNGKLIQSEHLYSNFSPVLYEVSKKRLLNYGYIVYNQDDLKYQ